MSVFKSRLAMGTPKINSVPTSEGAMRLKGRFVHVCPSAIHAWEFSYKPNNML